ncbi:MAG: VOC family protein [Alphaproteobacteria bacterium]|nr:VOC family protein [Alphaproteobacteria bacterium]
MDQRVWLITLAVADPARSKDFYEALGWKAGFVSRDIAFFQLNGIVLGLYRRTAFEAETGRTLSGSDGVALAINFAARDAVDAVLDEAVRAGGEIMRPAADTEWGGYSGYFADPDGHAWEVAHNPHWTIDDDGNVWMGDV